MARRIVFAEKLPLICSTRSLILGLRLVQSGYTWREAFEMTILKNALPKIKERILGLIAEAELKAKSKNSNTQQIPQTTNSKTTTKQDSKEVVSIKKSTSKK